MSSNMFVKPPAPNERVVLVVVGAGPVAFDALTEAGEVAIAEDYVETVAVVRCDDATAEALLDSLEDEVVVGHYERLQQWQRDLPGETKEQLQRAREWEQERQWEWGA